MLEGGPDGRDGFCLIGATPHPAADGPGTDRDRRYPERGTWNFGKPHVHFDDLCLIIHDFVPSAQMSARVGGDKLASRANNWRQWEEPGLLRGDKSECGPVQFAMTTRD